MSKTYIPIGSALVKPRQVLFNLAWLGGDKEGNEQITVGLREYERPHKVKSGRVRRLVPGKVTKTRIATQEELKYLYEEKGMTSIIGIKGQGSSGSKVVDAFDPNKEDAVETTASAKATPTARAQTTTASNKA